MVTKVTQSQSSFIERSGSVQLNRYRKCVSNSTILPNGKVNMKAQNAHSFEALSLDLYGVTTPTPNIHMELNPGGVYPGQPLWPPGFTISKLEQAALAQFNGRKRKGSASLGVTLGSWAQSSSMISARFQQASRLLDNAAKRLVNGPKAKLRRLRKERDPLANLVLENQFGWLPLLEDIRSAVRVLGGETIPTFLVGRQSADLTYYRPWSVVPSGQEGRSWTESYSGTARVTVAAECYVSNPNTFLLNHMGLLNPLAVAWDLIPWSFVVGMFVNVNAMLRSLSDDVGLTFQNQSTTISSTTTYSIDQLWINRLNPNFVKYEGGSRKRIKGKWRTRSVGSVPSVKWSVHVPELNRMQMLIAGSLVLQKITKLNKLLAL